MNNGHQTALILNYHGYGHAEDIARCIRQRGRHVTIITDKQTKVDNDSCDTLVRCKDILDIDEVVESIDNLIKQGVHIQDVVNTTCYISFVYYHLLKKFGDRFGIADWFLNTRIKPECRRLLALHNVSPVRHLLIKDETDLSKASNIVRFPAVIKPASGQGSDCVYEVANIDELRSRYAEIRKTPIEGIHPLYCKNVLVNDVAYDLTRDFLLEEYLNGKEYSVDGYIYNGTVVVAGVHQKYFSSEEDGFRDRLYVTPPANWSDTDQHKVENLINDVQNALGMDNTLFHIEIRMVEGEPKIIEINPRLGGGMIQENIVLSAGISLIDILADIICDRNVPLNPPQRDGVSFDFGVVIPRSGKVKSITGIEEIKRMDGIRGVRSFVHVGEEIKNLVGERFFLFCHGHVQTHEGAIHLYNQANNLFHYEIE